MLECPVCRIPLCRIDVGTVPVHVCPDCQGTLMGAMSHASATAVEWQAVIAACDLADAVRCPRCGLGMGRAHGRAGDAAVCVDFCRICELVWLRGAPQGDARTAVRHGAQRDAKVWAACESSVRKAVENLSAGHPEIPPADEVRMKALAEALWDVADLGFFVLDAWL